ncbi:putative endoglucanase EG-II [Glarea lozoyensis 74030]|uniref:cellulase n=1 Tax=Glarea lozoyensis (strain ATCC 74030 / MF5533) TaxID=1104152 RepID=H0EF67_GLAL7|nr:putative endoglucanase EG-II [Glarea lozoyensis 74030]
MQHFVKDDQMNIFRLPVSWQFLLNNKPIKYKANEKVIFGLMNEPHDVDIIAWATSCQAAVTAIRNVGATSQMILLPGNDFTSAGKFVANGSGAALLVVKNPDGTTNGLIFDIHKYLDVDNSGNHVECTTDNTEAFASVAQFLRENGRKGLVSETGAGSTASNSFINQNSDVYLGIIAWAAGSFSTSYTLSLTPTKQNGKFVDNKLASQCVVSVWLNAPTAVVTSAVVSPTSSRAGPSTSASALESATVIQPSGSVTSSNYLAMSRQPPVKRPALIGEEMEKWIKEGSSSSTVDKVCPSFGETYRYFHDHMRPVTDEYQPEKKTGPYLLDDNAFDITPTDGLHGTIFFRYDKSNDKVHATYRCPAKQCDKDSDRSDRKNKSKGHVVDPGLEKCDMCTKPLLSSGVDKQKAAEATAKFKKIYDKSYRRFFDGRAI